MKISSGTASGARAIERSAAAAPADSAAEATPGAAAGAGNATPLQSAVLQPAMAALRAMPDIDHERVALLRDALAKGELPFDAGKLAGLIQRFHGGES
ncbi:flagellar biosynthesis anti-sigma factor FlgM [Janthinobacterium agaricidamnosum]|nr:flagellar biosynthesis anti-sigma factor FlgM [Janthinobacterium agaricidamnosum]